MAICSEKQYRKLLVAAREGASASGSPFLLLDGRWVPIEAVMQCMATDNTRRQLSNTVVDRTSQTYHHGGSTRAGSSKHLVPDPLSSTC